MVKCDYCNEDISYLPFKCRHCGSSFCKKHRIAENHECSFQFINDPYRVKKLKSYEVPVAYTDSTQGSYGDFSKNNYNQKKPNAPGPKTPNMMSLLGLGRKTKATYSLMALNIVFFVISLLNVFDDYIYLSIMDFAPGNYRYMTLFTAMFVPGDLFSLFFNLLIIYMMGKMIEGRFGTKNYLKLYIISGLITGLFLLALQFLFRDFNVIITSYDPTIEDFIETTLTVREYSHYETTSGAIVGMITFMLMLLPQGEMVLFQAFRVKTKNFLWGFIILYCVIGLISLSQQDASFISNFACIFGVLGAKIVRRTLSHQK